MKNSRLNSMSQISFTAVVWGCISLLTMAMAMGCATTPKETDMFHIHSIYNDEILNEHRVDLAEKVFASGYVSHDPGRPDIGVEEMMQFFGALFEAFPDMKWTVLKRFVSDDMTTVYWEAAGTHKKEFLGIPLQIKKSRIPVSRCTALKAERSLRVGITLTCWV